MLVRFFILLVLAWPICGYAQDDEDSWESTGGYSEIQGEDVSDSIRVEEIIEPNSDYHYAPFGKDSPFVPPMVISKVKKRKRLKGKSQGPLTRYRLSELKFVGKWMSGNGLPKLLVMTPKGEGIVATKGTPIGDQNGTIHLVEGDEITIREFKEKADGTREYEDTIVSLSSGAAKETKKKEKSEHRAEGEIAH